MQTPQTTRVSGLKPHLAKSGVLHCDLTQEEVHVVPILNSVQEMGLCGRQERKHVRTYSGIHVCIKSRRLGELVNTNAQFGQWAQEKFRERAFRNGTFTYKGRQIRKTHVPSER